MPVAARKPDVVTNKQNEPILESSVFHGVVVDDKVTPLSSLITYVEGSQWTVTYYSQVLGKSNDLKDLDQQITPIQQQYTKINELELKVDNPLSQTQDTESTKFTVVGSALMYPVIVPNNCDLIVASAGSGRMGVYKVTNVERKSINRESVYFIEYELFFFVDKEVDRYSDLENKVIRSFFFSKDRLVQGLSSTITNEEHYVTKELEAKYVKLIKEYFRRFYSKTDSTLVIPGQNSRIYDHFLTKYILSIVDTFSANEVKNTRLLAVDELIGFEQDQFWSAMKNRDYDAIKYCNKEMGVVSIMVFANNPRANSPKYSNLDYLIYPTSLDTSTETTPSVNSLVVAFDTGLVEATNRGGTLADLVSGQFVTDARAYPIIKTVMCDEYYVLSKDFYNGNTNLSLLEELVVCYLKRESIDINKLNTLVTNSGDWGQLEVYYYYPILITLILSTIPGASTWL